jgi:hypothetical protein
MYCVPRWLVNLTGRGFFRLVKKAPFIFAIICMAGIGLGILLVYLPPDSHDRTRIPAKILGIVLLIPFYSAGFLFWIVKIVKRQWTKFCDDKYEFFATRGD